MRDAALVEGRVVGGFELCGTDHAQRSVASSLVVPTLAPHDLGVDQH